MAKTPERRQKLKVFRMPIGFHDAYVAAPSQKAALEAWGADSNLFAQGIAEQVEDPKLMEEPLANPGKVLKKVRGSVDEHFAELDRTPARKKPAEDGGMTVGAPKQKSKAKVKPKPSRDDLDAADEALEKAEKKQRKELRKLDEKMEALQRERREIQRRHESDRDKLAAKQERARSAYDQAMREWKSG
jgi:hypothetical protein